MSGQAPNWRRIADRLAVQLASHAFCNEHALSRPEHDCPFCADRAAYLAYLAAGGKDTRLHAPGPGVPIQDLPPNDRFGFSGTDERAGQ